MSASPEEREDGAIGDVEEEDVAEEMTNMADLPPTGHGREGEHREDQHITELLEQERQLDESSSSGKPAQDTGVVNRYKELAQGELDVASASDNGSADALPRRAGSPVDSTVSIPDDTPSVQVCYAVIFSQHEAQTDLARAP